MEAKGLEDPSLGIGTNGVIYYGYQNGDGHPHIAVSLDRGLHWKNNTDVGIPFGIQNAVYPAVTAGDGLRCRGIARTIPASCFDDWPLVRTSDNASSGKRRME